jgi:hypothetical protein
VIISVVYLLVRCLLGCLTMLSRGRKQVLSGLIHEYYVAA